MAYTIANQNKGFFSKIKPFLTYLLLFIVLGGIAYGVTVGMHRIPGLKRAGTLTVKTQHQNAIVFAEGEEIGPTPLEREKVPLGDIEVKIKSKNNPDRIYSNKIKVNAGVETALQRDLGISDLFSSGMNFWMERGDTALTVISQPSGAIVSIDGSEIGKTPLTENKVTEGNYKLTISAPNYEGQNVPIKIKNGYKLNVSAQLFPIPVPDETSKFDDSQDLYDLTIPNEIIGSSPDRAKAVIYWSETRGLDGGTNINFDYFLDAAGNAYNSQGNLVSTQEGFNALKDAQIGGYLGIGALGSGLTEAARETYLELFGSRQTGTILPTGFGWLRVRQSPNLNAAEVTRVDVGETFPVLEVQGNWVKLELADGNTGWVSGTYVEVN